MPDLPRRNSRTNLPSAKSLDSLSTLSSRSLCARSTPPRLGITTRTALGTIDYSQPPPSPSAQQSPQPPSHASRSAMGATFEVKCEETQWGDAVAVVGSTAQFGAWDPARALKLSTSSTSYPLWHLRGVVIPCDHDELEYKVIILRARDGNVVPEWEPIEGNRRLTLARTSGRDVLAHAEWGVPPTDQGVVPDDSPTSSPAPPTVGVPRPGSFPDAMALMPRLAKPSKSAAPHGQPGQAGGPSRERPSKQPPAAARPSPPPPQSPTLVGSGSAPPPIRDIRQSSTGAAPQPQLGTTHVSAPMATTGELLSLPSSVSPSTLTVKPAPNKSFSVLPPNTAQLQAPAGIGDNTPFGNSTSASSHAARALLSQLEVEATVMNQRSPHRPGEPLGPICSMDLSWPPSLASSLSGSIGSLTHETSRSRNASDRSINNSP